MESEQCKLVWIHFYCRLLCSGFRLGINKVIFLGLLLFAGLLDALGNGYENTLCNISAERSNRFPDHFSDGNEWRRNNALAKQLVRSGFGKTSNQCWIDTLNRRVFQRCKNSKQLRIFWMPNFCLGRTVLCVAFIM